MSPPAPPQKPLAKDSSHFGSHGKCEVGLDCLEFSSFQTVWVSGVPSFVTEGWCACPTNPCGHSLGSRHSDDLIPVKGVGSERPERLVWVTSWEEGQDGLPRSGMRGCSFAGSYTTLKPHPSSPACCRFSS